MPNPKRRHSQARRDKRRANWKLTAPTLVRCSNADCDSFHLTHAACPKCGMYNGRVLSIFVPNAE